MSTYLNEFSKQFSERVYEMDMTQKAIAELLNISEFEVYRYMHGKGFPSVDKLHRICDVMGFDINDMIVTCKLFDKEQKELFPMRLKRAMEENNLSEKEFRIKCKISSRSLNNYLNGTVIPGRIMVLIMEDVLNLEEGYFYKVERT